MSNLYLWIPKDFDERYKKYSDKLINSDNKKPEPSLVDKLVREKEDFLLIKNKTEYESEMKKWEPLKIIVDEIYTKLSHLYQKPQVVDINISELNIPNNIAGPVLMELVYEGVCKWRIDSNPIIQTSTNIREYLKGNKIIVQNYETFRSLRKEIVGFYNFLEEQKVIKFPISIIEPVFTNLEHQKKVLERSLDESLKEEALIDKILNKIEGSQKTDVSNTKSKTTTTTRKDIFIENDFLYFEAEKIPVERGQKSIVDLLLKNANVCRDGKLSKNGKAIEITKLVEVGGYKDESAFRDGLKRLRSKIEKTTIPVTIENPTTGKYQMYIKYQ